MLKSAALALLLASAPAVADEAPRTDVATLQKLATQAWKLLHREPADLALAVAQVDVADEFAQALRQERTRPANRLKVAPR